MLVFIIENEYSIPFNTHFGDYISTRNSWQWFYCYLVPPVTLFPKHHIIWLSNVLIMNVLNEVYSGVIE
jgi:hypothetical protein